MSLPSGQTIPINTLYWTLMADGSDGRRPARPRSKWPMAIGWAQMANPAISDQ